MRLVIVAVLLLGGMFIVAPASGQTPPATGPVTRSVIAEAKVHIIGDVPLYFRAVGVIVPANETTSFFASADGVLYEMSGATAATIGAETKNLNPHEGVFIAAGRHVVLKAANDIPSTLMHFMLSRVVDLDRPEAAAPATTIEVLRMPKPIPGLKPGRFDLNLTLVTFPPHIPSNPPHHRSGAALYYILSGAGANTIGGKTETKGVGSMIYEPFGLVHQWANPGDEPLRFIAFNINPEGVPAVLPGSPAKTHQ